MSRWYHLGARNVRPRRHGLKLAGGYRCRCCYVEQRGKARERRMRDKEIAEQTQVEEDRCSCGVSWSECYASTYGED